jgi:imidazolonepropionase-like amidohydrolase
MIVFKGGTLIDGTGAAPVHDPAVVIRDGRVEAVTTAGANAWPKDAEIIDVSGKTVLPGLIDCHDHMALHGYDLARRWNLDEPASTRALRTAQAKSTTASRRPFGSFSPLKGGVFRRDNWITSARRTASEGTTVTGTFASASRVSARRRSRCISISKLGMLATTR